MLTSVSRQNEMTEMDGAFIEAVENNDLPLAKSLLAQGADPAAESNRAISFAVANAFIQMTHFLLLQPSVEVPIHFSKNPTIRSYLNVARGEVYKASHEYDLDDEERRVALARHDEEVFSVFLVAIARGNIKVVSDKIHHRATRKHIDSDINNETYRLACESGHEKIASLILSTYVQVQQRHLLMCSRTGQVSEVEHLLEPTRYPFLLEKKGTLHQAYCLAREHGHDAIASRLWAIECVRKEALYVAIESGMLSEVETLTAEFREHCGVLYRAMSMAIRMRQLDVVEFILRNEYYIAMLDIHYVPTQEAIKWEQIDILERLLTVPRIRDLELIRVCWMKNGLPQVRELVEKYGANPAANDNEALCVAVRMDNLGMLDYLLSFSSVMENVTAQGNRVLKHVKYRGSEVDQRLWAIPAVRAYEERNGAHAEAERLSGQLDSMQIEAPEAAIIPPLVFSTHGGETPPLSDGIEDTEEAFLEKRPDAEFKSASSRPRLG